MRLFKSKEERALEAKMAVRQGIRELDKCSKTLEKKKAEMIAHAQKAKSQGITQQYQVAVNGLKMILTYQKRAQAMALQLHMAETVRDLTSMSVGFVKMLGMVGKEVSKVTASAGFAKNQLVFEKGMLSSESAMEKLEAVLDNAGMSMESFSEEEIDDEIARLIDVTGAAGQDELDAEIEERLAELESKRSGMKG